MSLTICILSFNRIHFETSSVLIRQMPLELVTMPLGWKYGPTTTGKLLQTLCGHLLLIILIKLCTVCTKCKHEFI